MNGPAAAPPRLGIVIPTLNEEASLPALLEDLKRIPIPNRILVVDGGSRDGTAEVARVSGASVVQTGPGRARQMNVGASLIDAPWTLFLHADSRMPARTARALAEWLATPGTSEAAHFVFQLDLPGFWGHAIEWGQRAREHLTGLAYGDQGLVISRGRLAELGGIPELPLMEDVEVIRRLRAGRGVDRINAPIVTDGRRYRREGPLYTSLRNNVLITMFSLGISPDRLVRWYAVRSTSAP